MKRTLVILSLFFIFTNFIIVGVKRSDAKPSNKGDTVIEINNQKITREAFGEFLISSYGDVALDFLVKKIVVLQEAKKNNIQIGEKELNERYEKVADVQVLNTMQKQGIKSKEDFELELFKTGITLDKYRKKIISQIKNQTEIEFIVEKIILEDITFTEDELHEAYINIFGEKVKVNQIVLKTRKKAEEVLSKLKGGAKFSKVAQKESIDRASAARGGEMMPLGTESILGKAALDLKAGEISTIIETGYGYHILQFVKFIEGSDKPFEEVLDFLENVVKSEKLNQQAQPWLQNLFETTDVEVFL